MKRSFVLLLASFALIPAAAEDFHFEVTALGWRSRVGGTLQAGPLPVDLQSDLNLEKRWTFFGRLVAKPGRRHRIILEGAPYSFEGSNTLSRSIEFNGRVYDIEDTVASKADLTYVFGGYQYDFMNRRTSHAGVQIGAAYLDASGTIKSNSTGLSATRSQQLGIPLVGLEYRTYLIPRVLSANVELKGMALGDYGHFVQGSAYVAIGLPSIAFVAGYQVVDADVHEANGGANPVGIAPRIRGGIFGIQFRH